jgi:hypothetical protein
MRPWSFAHECHGQDVVLMVDFLPAVWGLVLVIVIALIRVVDAFMQIHYLTA